MDDISIQDDVVAVLYKKMKQLPLTEQELVLLQQWQQQSASNKKIMEELGSARFLRQAIKERYHINKQSGWEKVARQTIDRTSSGARPQPAGIHILKTAWFRYAAAVILVVSVGAYLYTRSYQRPSTNESEFNQMAADIQPGTNKAFLTLADGSTIALDSAVNGRIASQGNAHIIKNGNGSIIYNPAGVSEGEMMMNTMSTPKGGQYQLTLPDGTKVWLNAASSITYPAAFTGTKRKVTITGEVYLEVAGNRKEPFIVDADGRSLIEVLGTSFNINAYPDEHSIKTTLSNGSVRVIAGIEHSARSVLLKPGQQAVVDITAASTAEPIEVLTNVDLNQALAWKNGVFHLNTTNLAETMRQLERWYNVDVRYEKGVPDIKLGGKIKRDLTLSQMLEALKELGVKLKLEGKTIVVS